MGTKFTATSISGYNASPPVDDGSTTEANRGKWSTIKTKLSDPVKTAVESNVTALATALDTSARAITSSDSSVAGDHDRVIQVNTASVIVTLADAATMAAGYRVTVYNNSSGSCTVNLATSTNTIDGVTNTTNTINSRESRMYIVNAATTGYNTTAQSTSSLPPFRNRYANGDFSIDQIKEGAAHTFASATDHAMDCVRASATGAGTFTLQRVADPDNANLYALKVACTVADSSIAATDNYYIQFPIEGFDVSDIGFGTSSATSITVSFDMKFDVTGTYGISISNALTNRVYIGTVTQSVASTLESKTVTLTADTSGTWASTNTTGVNIRFCLSAGSNFQGTAGSWGTSNLFTTSAQANFMSANTNVGYIKNLQFEKGASASSFERVTRTQKLARLQRYYEKSFVTGPGVTGVAPVQNYGSEGGAEPIGYKAQVAGTTAGYAIFQPFKAFKRASPTLTGYSTRAASSAWYNLTTGAASGNSTFDFSSSAGGLIRGFFVVNPQAAGDNAGDQIVIAWTADARMT